MTRCCEVCKQPVSDEDFREVVLRNKMIVGACLKCWVMWPDDWKFFPDFGYGRVEAHRLESV